MQLQAQVLVCAGQQLNLEGQAGNGGHLLCTCPPGGFPAGQSKDVQQDCMELSPAFSVAQRCCPRLYPGL